MTVYKPRSIGWSKLVEKRWVETFRLLGPTYHCSCGWSGKGSEMKWTENISNDYEARYEPLCPVCSQKTRREGLMKKIKHKSRQMGQSQEYPADPSVQFLTTEQKPLKGQFVWDEVFGITLSPTQKLIHDWYSQQAADYGARGICCVACRWTGAILHLVPRFFWINPLPHRRFTEGHCPVCGEQLVR